MENTITVDASELKKLSVVWLFFLNGTTEKKKLLKFKTVIINITFKDYYFNSHSVINVNSNFKIILVQFLYVDIFSSSYFIKVLVLLCV